MAVGLVIVWNVCVASRQMMMRHHPRPSDWLLLFWLAAEFVGYFLFSPFAAARRLVGIVIAATLVLGRSYALSPNLKSRVRTGLCWLAGINVAAGLAMFGIDWLESAAARTAAYRSAALIRSEDPDAAIWFDGHWGFEFYAEQLGMRPIDADHTVLRAGESLVIPEPNNPSEVLAEDPGALVPFHTINVDDLIPFSTVGYYGGPLPLEHRHGPRQSVSILRSRQGHAFGDPVGSHRTVKVRSRLSRFGVCSSGAHGPAGEAERTRLGDPRAGGSRSDPIGA